MKGLISIVVPIYNVEKYIDKCIESLINQTYKNIEIILVDDGSKDNCGNIIENFAKKDRRIKIIHKENGGLSDARNYGIDIAKGEYICFVDSDDYVKKDMCECMLKLSEKYNSDITILNRIYKFDNGDEKLRFIDDNKILELNKEEALIELNSFNNFDMSAWGKLYKMKLFENIRFPVGRLSEDYFIMYKLFDNSNKIVYSSYPVYYYMQRDGSISKSKKINYDYIEASYNQMIEIEEKYPNLKGVVHTSYVLANLTVYNLHLKKKVKCTKENKKLFKKRVKENMKYVKNNKYISKDRKIQTYIFSKSIFIYNIIFYLYKKTNKV